MSGDQHDAARSEQLSRIVADYRAAVESGTPPEREELLKRHPEFADDLRRFFAQLDEPDVTMDLAAMPTDAPESTPIRDDEETLPPSETTFTPRPASASGGRFGDYELLDEIARGGMGVVYRARQVSLNRIVALKMILAGNLASEEDVSRFHAEAEAAAHLDHPGIVTIHEVGEIEGQHFFSMTYIEGESLAAKTRNGPLGPREAAELLVKISRAVGYAHGHGVIHRDLKPPNVLIDECGEPHVTDFGLAKSLETDSHLTRTGQVMGTPSYMPPEQAAGEFHRVTALADVYSLGAVLYTLLTGRPPFQAATPFDTLRHVMEREPVSPHELNLEVPRDLETICLKCLEKDPRRRYGSADELADELERFLNGKPIEARPVGKAEQCWRWCRRNPVVAGLWATVAASLLIGIAVSSYFAVEASSERDAAELARGDMETQRDEANRHRRRAEEQQRQAVLARRAAEEAQRQTRRHLYVSDMMLIQQFWNEANIGAIHDLLDRHRPAVGQEDLREFGWYYWWRTSRRYEAVIEHAEQVCAVALSPDEQTIATSDNRGTIRLWDAATGDLNRSFKEHTYYIWAIAFSPDGKRLASSGGSDKTVKVWDLATGNVLHTLTGHNGSVGAVAFSPDGGMIASGSYDRTVKLWDADTGELEDTLTGHGFTIRAVAFSPDGRMLASGASSDAWKLWDLATGDAVHTGKENVWSLAFSPDGQTLAIGRHDGVVRLCGVETGRTLRLFEGHANRVRSLAFTPDGKTLCSSGQDNTIRVWDVASGQTRSILKGHSNWVTSIALYDNGRRLVSASQDGTAKLWNLESPEHVTSLEGHNGSISNVQFLPGGHQLASCSPDWSVRIWDSNTGQLVRMLKEMAGQSVWYLDVAPDGQEIATVSADGALRTWDVATGELNRTIAAHSGKSAFAVAYSPDGRLLATGGEDETAKIWDATTGELLHTLNGPVVLCVTFSPDGRHLVTGGYGYAVRVWDVETGEFVRGSTEHAGNIHAIAFSPDGRTLATGSVDRTVILWDFEVGKPRHVLRGHGAEVMDIAFSPDGKTLASASDDRTIKLWDVPSGELRSTLRGHDSRVECIAFSDDGRLLASAGADRTIRLWRAATEEDVWREPSYFFDDAMTQGSGIPWHVEQARIALDDEKWFAAIWHLDRVQSKY